MKIDNWWKLMACHLPTNMETNYCIGQDSRGIAEDQKVINALVEIMDDGSYKLVNVAGVKVDLPVPNISGWKPVPLCQGNYYFCTAPNGKFPKIDKVPDEWTACENDKRLEFRKMHHPAFGYTKGFEVEPVIKFEKTEWRFPPFAMSDYQVLDLWMRIIRVGGYVSDGVINLFG
jgi:hypothetical protein